MLIGLHGKKQAGKDTVCERMKVVLADRKGATVERVSFADKLYESAAAALGVPSHYLRTHKSDPTAIVEVQRLGLPVSRLTFREYLQRYGTEAHRDVFADNFWVDNVDLAHDRKIVAVTDVRFRNEAQAVIDAGGSVVHVMGPPEVESAGDGHASEETLPDRYIDHVLINAARNDNFAALDSAVCALFLRLLRNA